MQLDSCEKRWHHNWRPQIMTVEISVSANWEDEDMCKRQCASKPVINHYVSSSSLTRCSTLHRRVFTSSGENEQWFRRQYSTKQCTTTSQSLHRRLVLNHPTHFEPWSQEQPAAEEIKPGFIFPRQVCKIKDNHIKAEVALTVVSRCPLHVSRLTARNDLTQSWALKDVQVF